MAVVAKCGECSRPFLKNNVTDLDKCLACIRKEKTANSRLETIKESTSINSPDNDSPNSNPDTKCDQVNSRILDKSPHKEVPLSVQLAHDYWDEA